MDEKKLPPIVPFAKGGPPSLELPPQFKAGQPVATFNPPRGDWRIRLGGHLLKPYDICHPGHDYHLEVNTLCGQDVYELDAEPTMPMTAVEFARRAQISASIGHVTRRACRTCRDGYTHALTPTEKKWLYATNPEMGAVLGFGAGGQALADIADGKVGHKPFPDAPKRPLPTRPTNTP